jgi:hypothetical protein
VPTVHHPMQSPGTLRAFEDHLRRLTPQQFLSVAGLVVHARATPRSELDRWHAAAA